MINHISIKIAARSDVCVIIMPQYADMHIKLQLFSCNFVIFFVDFTGVKCYYDENSNLKAVTKTAGNDVEERYGGCCEPEDRIPKCPSLPSRDPELLRHSDFTYVYLNCSGFKGSRRRRVKAQGLLDPMSGGESRNLSGTAGVFVTLVSSLFLGRVFFVYI